MSLKIKPLQKYECIICGDMAERHHIKTRGSGGDDSEGNILFVCRPHHNEIHVLGKISFAEKYKVFKDFLLHYGWTKCELTGKWTHE